MGAVDRFGRDQRLRLYTNLKFGICNRLHPKGAEYFELEGIFYVLECMSVLPVEVYFAVDISLQYTWSRVRGLGCVLNIKNTTEVTSIKAHEYVRW